MSVIFIACAAITAISAFTSLGFSIAAARGAGEGRIVARYGLSRSIALAAVSVVPLFNGSEQWLHAVAAAMVIVQVADGYVGIRQHDAIKTFGPFLLAALNLTTLILLARQ